MLVTLEGSYRNGTVELAEAPPSLGPAKVLVTFVSAGDGAALDPSSAGIESVTDREREEAKARILARMERGYPLGGGPYYKTRDELYDRIP